MAKAMAKDALPVIVTTAHRGVFFGYTDHETGETIALAKIVTSTSQEAST